MANYKTTRVIPITLTLIIIAIGIAGLVSLARLIFFSGGTGTTTLQADISKAALLDTSVDRAVRMTVRGAIVADETFRSYQIQITPNERNFTTYKGYLDQPINYISFGNNVQAYEQFVYALNRANFMKSNELTGDKNDYAVYAQRVSCMSFKFLKQMNH